MRAVITVIGKDMVGILAAVATKCADCGVNVQEVTQSVLDDMFAMIMLVDISDINVGFAEFADMLENLGKERNLMIKAMHEDIFNAMHRI